MGGLWTGYAGRVSDLSVAILTDVHGNGLAVQAVADDIRRHAPDLVVNLGDQVWGQARPELALEVQLALGGVQVRGNNDERLRLPPGDSRLSPAHAALQTWLCQRLPASELERLAQLPTDALVADSEVLATHGAPGSPWDSLLWAWTAGGAEFWPRPDAEIEARLADVPWTPVVVVGHSHREQVREWGGRLLVGAGPVAHQTDGDLRACWTLLRRRRGVWQAEMRRVTYDWHAAARAVRVSGGPDPSEAALHDRPRTVLGRPESLGRGP